MSKEITSNNIGLIISNINLTKFEDEINSGNYLLVNEKIDEILKNINDNDYIKIELLKIKAKAIGSLGGVSEIQEIFKEIDNIIMHNISFSEDILIDLKEKNKIALDIYIIKMDIIFQNIWKMYEKDNIIDFEKIIIEESDKIIEKGFIGEGNYKKYIYYLSYGNNKSEALKYLDISTNKGHNKSIFAYITHLESDFLEQYKSKKTEKEKENFLDENLIEFEEKYYKFIDDIKDKNGNIIKKGNKELYLNLGILYEQIGFYSDAVSAYLDGISYSKKGYILYGNIAEIYLKNKINIEILIKSNIEIAKETYQSLKKLSELNDDSENYILALEKLGDISLLEYKNKEEAENYYIKAINNGKENNSLTNIQIERLSMKIIQISNNELNIQYSMQNLLNIDIKHILTIAEFYEEQGNIEDAFYNYLNAYQTFDDKGNFSIEESANTFAMFIETTLLEKTINDSKNYFKRIGLDIDILDDDEMKEEIEYQIELQEEEIKIKKALIKKIVGKIDKNAELLREDIATLFEMSLLDDFYDENVSNNVEVFINNYNLNIPNYNIFLHKIIENIINFDGNKKNELINVLLKKIYDYESLSNEDIKNIKSIVSLNNNKEEFTYSSILADIRKKALKGL